MREETGLCAVGAALSDGDGSAGEGCTDEAVAEGA